MQRVKGIAMIVSGAVFWGASGPLMEWLLGETGVSVPFLLTIRLVLAGALILLFLKLKNIRVTAIFKQPIWIRPILLFSIFGMLGVQYTFVAAIEASNAVVATLLQFAAPLYVILIVSLNRRAFPPIYQVIGMAGTLIGLFLLLTGGNPTQLLINEEALLWGIAVGIAFAFYTLYPIKLMMEWGVFLVVGWSMLIGGLFLGLIQPVVLSPDWALIANGKALAVIFLIILFGTLGFMLFLASMQYITPVETSVMSSLEPLTAMIISLFWFGSRLGSIQLIGVACMIGFVVYLSAAGSSRETEKVTE